jgi:hypothetical protein
VLLWRSTPPMPAAAALHPLNGVVIFLVALYLAWTTRGYLRSGAALS